MRRLFWYHDLRLAHADAMQLEPGSPQIRAQRPGRGAAPTATGGHKCDAKGFASARQLEAAVGPRSALLAARFGDAWSHVSTGMHLQNECGQKNAPEGVNLQAKRS